MITPPNERIEIPINSIGFPSQECVLTVETYMQFPDDPVARAKARKIVDREVARRRRRKDAPLSVDTAEERSNTVALKRLQHSHEEESKRAAAAGFMLMRSVQEAAIDPRSKDARKGAIKAKMSEFFYIIEISLKTVENTVWKKYRRVSHLWAAYLYGVWFDGSNPEKIFPCTIEGLPKFLAVAEAFRKRGEGSGTWKSPVNILKAGECFTLPENLKLPSIGDEFASWLSCFREHG